MCIPTVAVMRGLYFNEDIVSAIEDKRLHHQLVPNVLFYESQSRCIHIFML